MQEVEKCRVVQRGVRATGCKGMSDPIHIRRARCKLLEINEAKLACVRVYLEVELNVEQ